MIQEKVKLQLFLSRNDVCSRRRAFDFIKKGYVKVNGVVIYEPSYMINCSLLGKVRLNDKKITPKGYEYILLNKPGGVTTTRKDRFAKRTVLDLIPEKFRHLNPVGRLDKDTTGLLLLTNDGQLAYRLTHPRFKIDKIYRLSLNKVLSPKDGKTLERGILLEDGMSAACKIEYLKNRELEITIHEGRKRQIKRMFAGLKYRVSGLERIKEGVLSLGSLPLGKWRHLTGDEIKRLICEVGPAGKRKSSNGGKS